MNDDFERAGPGLGSNWTITFAGWLSTGCSLADTHSIQTGNGAGTRGFCFWTAPGSPLGPVASFSYAQLKSLATGAWAGAHLQGQSGFKALVGCQTDGATGWRLASLDANNLVICDVGATTFAAGDCIGTERIDATHYRCAKIAGCVGAWTYLDSSTICATSASNDTNTFPGAFFDPLTPTTTTTSTTTTTIVTTTTTSTTTTTTTLASQAATNFATTAGSENGDWGFEESAGSIATDRTTNGNNLADAGTVARDTTAAHFTDGLQSASFTAGTQHFDLAGNASIDMAGTTATWFMCYRATNTAGNWVLFHMNGGETLGYGVFNQGAPMQCRAEGVTVNAGTATVNSLFCYACVLGSGTLTSYQDGASQASGAVASISSPGNEFEVGANGNSNSAAGQIDDLAISPKAWTANQVLFASSCGTTGQLCRCVTAAPTTYLACTVNADCRLGGNTTALCTSSTCRGRLATNTAPCNQAAP